MASTGMRLCVLLVAVVGVVVARYPMQAPANMPAPAPGPATYKPVAAHVQAAPAVQARARAGHTVSE